MATRMTTIERYRAIDRNYKYAGFIANVIMTSASNRAKKMKGLYNLLTSGKIVCSGHCFDIWTINIDGRNVPMSDLEKYA